ncbi:hypothetical protein PPACK8108_LOCUS8993 [Phakopsora pachyrhizi]|nr:hypothetical protein PPACK8108_LOCUS8993 [Phakopsora pachyrhizi]
MIRKFQFQQLINACLWGNATDLSLLPNLDRETLEKIQKSQSQDKIIKDDFE